MSLLQRILFIILLHFSVLSSTSVAETTPSAFQLLDGSGYRFVALSPDGSRAAYIYASPEQYCLDRLGQAKDISIDKCRENEREFRSKYVFGVADVAEDGLIPVNSVPLPGDTYIDWIEWASNERILAALVRRSTFNKQTGRTAIGGARILSFDRDLEIFTTLFGDRKNVNRNNRFISRITDFLPNDPDHVLIAANEYERLDLWKVNIITGESEVVADGGANTFFWFTNNQGEPFMRFDETGVYTRGAINVFVWSKEQQKWEKVRTIRTRRSWDGDVEYEFFPVAFTDDPNQVIVISDEEEEPRRTVRIFDYKKNEYVETLFEHPEMDVADVVLNSTTGKYVGTRYYVDRLQYAFADSKLQAHYKAMNAYFENKYNISLSSVNSNSQLGVIFASSPSDPGGFYLYDYDNPSFQPLYASKPDLLGFSFGEAEILKVPVRDGVTITAYLTYPATGKSATAPLIVMPHGGPESRDYYEYDPLVQFLSTRGYQVLQVNFRGSSGYGRDFAEAGYLEWGGVMQNDLTDVVRYIHENALAPSDQTCIVGGSYGGYAALVGATKTPELYKCVVSVAGVSDLIDFLSQTRRRYNSDSDVYEYWQNSIGSPTKDKEKLKDASPANFAANVRAPVLLIHGEYDGIVQIEQSQKMFSALRRAGADVEFIKIENEGHSGWSLKNELLYFNKLESFLAEHLQ